MPHSVGLDVSQKTTAICVVDAEGRRVWTGACPTDPGQISQLIFKHAGTDAKLDVETGAMTPWLVHGLRAAGLHVAVLDVLVIDEVGALEAAVVPGGLVEHRDMRFDAPVLDQPGQVGS